MASKAQTLYTLQRKGKQLIKPTLYSRKIRSQHKWATHLMMDPT